MWSGVITVVLLSMFTAAWMAANSIATSLLLERWISLGDGFVGHMLMSDSTVATGLREMASAPLCHLPGQCWIVKWYLRHFSLSLKRRGLFTLPRSLSPNIPVSGWWSVTTITLGQPMMNRRHFSLLLLLYIVAFYNSDRVCVYHVSWGWGKQYLWPLKIIVWYSHNDLSMQIWRYALLKSSCNIFMTSLYNSPNLATT